MKKILLPLLAFGLLSGIPTASAITFKEKFPVDKSLKKAASISLDARKKVPARADDALVTSPEGTKKRFAMSVDIYLSGIGATHVGGFGAEFTFSDDAAACYTRALTLNFFQQGYSTGSLAGDSIVFKTGDYIYDTKDGEKAYLYAAYLEEDEAWPEIVDDFVLVKDEKGRYVSAPDCYFMVLTEEEAEMGISDLTDFICFGTNYVFTPLPDGVAEDKMPADAQIFDCKMMANSLADYGGSSMRDITVGIADDKIYIGGLCDYLPESTLVGVKSGGNTYTFSSHQYIGAHDEGDYPYVYEYAMVNPLHFDGESLYFQEADSVTMTFNSEKTLLALEEDAGIFNNAYGDLSSWNDIYWKLLISSFDNAATPQLPSDVAFYGSYGAPYLFFDWNAVSQDGLPLVPDNLWCEVYINGQQYTFTPEFYEGLAAPTDKLAYSLSGVSGLYVGGGSTLYLYEFEGNASAVKSVGLRFGYEAGGEVRYTGIVYAKGYEPFEDKAFVPSAPGSVVYYNDYYHNFRFSFDGMDDGGDTIPSKLLGVEISLDGRPLVFKDSDYYFADGGDTETTWIGIDEFAPFYSSSIVSKMGNDYLITLWGHNEIPEFKTLAVRMVCCGGGAVTYGEPCVLDLERPATPADPSDVSYDADSRKLKFAASPVDAGGNGLAPWNYGCEVYVNDALYSFSGDLYGLDKDISLVPNLGFEYNYNFYLHTDYVYDETSWTLKDKKLVMEISMLDDALDINKIGVRAVYTDRDGVSTYSEIINSDGTTGGTVAVDEISSDSVGVKWYNLQGIEVARPVPGAFYIREANGRRAKVLVK